MDVIRISTLILLIDIVFVSTYCCILSKTNKSANCTRIGLKNVPLNLPGWVIHIDLSDNYIEEVKNGDFKRLYNLRSINLNNNRISKLDAEAFKGLKNLEELSLNNNRLAFNDNAFKPGVFKPLGKLQSLFITNNIQNCYDFPKLQRYPDMEFGYLRNLKRLSLDLYRQPMFGKSFRGMHSLQILIFNQCCLRYLTNKTFDNLPSSITELHMTHCYYISPQVGINAFKPFKYLKVLNLRMTPLSLQSAIGLLYPLRLKSMDIIDFHQVNRYPKVDGHYQFSVILTDSMFSNLKTICVKKLDLSSNAIVEMRHGSLFSWGLHTKCVEHLILSGNAFHFAYDLLVDVILLLASHYLDMNLKIFEYSYAPIEFPDYYKSEDSARYSLKAKNSSDIVKRLINNERDLYKLPLNTKGPCKYWNKNSVVGSIPPTLHTLRLSHVIAYLYFCNYSFPQNNLQVVDISYSLVDNLFLSITGLDNVNYLDASGIDFTKASQTFLKSVSNVTSLVLQDVELDRVFLKQDSQTIFYYNSKIKHLNLARNHLTDLPKYIFQNMEHLENLNLSLNSLDKFPPQILDKQFLAVLDLSNNKISGFNKETIDFLDAKYLQLVHNNLSIYLNGNILLCTCEYMEFIQWIYNTKVKLDNDGNYICTLSNGTQTTTKAVRAQFHEIFSKCKSTFWLTLSIVSVCVFVLILIGSVICYRLRWRIVYFFYRQFHYGYKPIRNDESSYTYDAFVAYSGEDYRWICSTFREELETSHSFKLCLHDRDFEPGLSIQQNIINSICNSRKVIIDATPGYIKSKWFEFEIEMANIEMMNRSYENGIIVIIRNGTKPSDMPDLLRRLWENITCVVHEKNEVEETFFERIVTALKS